ncbi:FAD-dependent monooxygenase [Paenibacillus sp. IB182496]|uniref:FAD-dependent monooxygenase n=1 Tax=Paenibacillus sabuli TaxID=2772509 RepID=A0A927BWA3_9BACL|nr:NAD(P)/FAD-dependent oxidoreductase [Paenibacillus sabuli]MBD2846639.1 FAD-dependent monooxygenase [Paenibacillus sabuli]
MSGTSDNQAAIIGCGIAGPAAALFLQRAGYAPVIYEAAQAHDDYAGLFLNLGRNGMRVLDELRVGDTIRRAGFEMRLMRFRSGAGKALGEVGRLGGEPQGWTVKRGELQRALREAAARAGIPIRLGHKLASVQTGRERALMTFADGSHAGARLIVGCDGIHSALRRQVLPDAPSPQYTGLISFGGFAQDPETPFVPGVQQMMFGRRAFFGYVAHASGEVYWFGNEEVPGSPTRRDMLAIPQDEWERRALALYAGEAPQVERIIRRTVGGIGAFPIYDMPPQPLWHRDNAVLIGDAIHAISPNAGQGASLALEDAMELARCLRDHPAPQQAFAAFQALRSARVERIVRYSRTLGARKYARSRVQVFFRDLMMPHFLKAANKDGQTWIYDHRIDWQEPAPAAGR